VTNPVLAKAESFSRPAVSPQAQQFGPDGQPVYTPWAPPAGQTQPGQPYAQYAPPVQPGYPQAYPQAYPQEPGYPQNGYPPAGYPQPTWQVPPAPTGTQQVMTLDDVLTKTALTLGLVIVVGVGAWWATIALGLNVATLATAGIICGLATIIFPFVAAARRKVGPGIAIPFAILEGVFIGAVSLIFEIAYPGIVVQAVMATFVAAALTLAAFKFGKFRLSSKMLKILSLSMIGFVVVALLNLGLSFAGINLGLFPGPYEQVSLLAWAFALLGVVLAVGSLVADFQFVEQGIANRVPASESWRAAYGLTVTLVWLYVNLLRILSYIRR